jgi:hypothetical protein
VLRAAGKTETTQENIQQWIEMDEGDTRFQLLTEEETAAVICFYLHLTALPILLNFPFIYFLRVFFRLLGLSFASLIWIIG